MCHSSQTDQVVSWPTFEIDYNLYIITHFYQKIAIFKTNYFKCIDCKPTNAIFWWNRIQEPPKVHSKPSSFGDVHQNMDNECSSEEDVDDEAKDEDSKRHGLDQVDLS
jgi:hypothetical protein